MNKKSTWRIFILCALLFSVSGSTSFAIAAEETYTNSIGMEFILVPAGSFVMETYENFEDAYGDDPQQEQVTLIQPFYLGKFEVTQEQWIAVMEHNPSKFTGRNNPVEQVSLNDCLLFIQRLNQKEGHARYRLPLEAEWKYASIAGDTSPSENDEELGDSCAWYNENSENTTHPVGQGQPNSWGMYNMHDNVLEWMLDEWFANYLSSGVIGPEGPLSDLDFAKFGDILTDPNSDWRSKTRSYTSPDGRFYVMGLRLAFSPEQ